MMNLRSALSRALPLVLALCFAGAVSAAGQDSPDAEKPQVDCQKNPTHPDCKKGN